MIDVLQKGAQVNRRPRIVAVSGGSGSGKTTVVNMIREACGRSHILTLQMDHYYKDLSHLPPRQRDLRNFDEPDAFDTALLKEHLSCLLGGKRIERPTYDFATHTRTGDVIEILPERAIVLDGILALADSELRTLFDLSVYVEVSDDVRFIRRLMRDISERGRTVEGVIEQYLASVKPMHDLHVVAQKNVADIIVSWEEYNMRAVAMLSAMIKGWIRD